MRDLHRLVVFVEDEVFLAQPGREAPCAVRHRRGDVDQLDPALEAEALLAGDRPVERGECDESSDRRCDHPT